MTSKRLSFETDTFGISALHDSTTLFHCLLYWLKTVLPFLGRPLPLPSLDFLSSSLLLGLVGAAEVPLIISPLSLRESPLPESLEEFFLSLRLAFALRRASWMLVLDEDNQLPLISLFMFLLEMADLPLSSSPDAKESLRSSASVGLHAKMAESLCLSWQWVRSFSVKNRSRRLELIPTFILIYIYVGHVQIRQGKKTQHSISICSRPLNVARAAEWNNSNATWQNLQARKEVMNHFRVKKSQCPRSDTADGAFKSLWLAPTYPQGLRSTRPRSQLPCFTVEKRFCSRTARKKWIPENTYNIEEETEM